MAEPTIEPAAIDPAAPDPGTKAPGTPRPPEGVPEGSPLRSIAAVMLGWLVLQWVLWPLFGAMIARIFAGELDPPSERFLAAMTLGMLPNGIVAGLLTARVAGWAPLAHAAVLGGLIGFFGMMSSDAAQGLPGWFAIARVVVPAISVVIGGAVSRLIRRAPKQA